MKISPISNNIAAIREVAPSAIREQLVKLAEQHNVSVDELLKSAEAAGTSGAPYLIRAGNLKRRLERLESVE